LVNLAASNLAGRTYQHCVTLQTDEIAAAATASMKLGNLPPESLGAIKKPVRSSDPVKIPAGVA